MLGQCFEKKEEGRDGKKIRGERISERNKKKKQLSMK